MAIWKSGRDLDGTHRISGGSEEKKPEPKNNMIAYWDLDEKNSPTGDRIPYTGSPKWTKLDSVQVILNGYTLDESEYKFDLDNNVVILYRSIKNTDTYFEIRSQVCNSPTAIVDNVLILPVSKHLPHDMLVHFTPNFGDEVSIERIEQYEENKDPLIKIGMANLAEIITAHVKDDGLYATIKFSIQQ